jgi:hypothetical protein
LDTTHVGRLSPEIEQSIFELVRGIAPVDWVQVELIAKLPPARRLAPGLHAQEFARAPEIVARVISALAI